MNKLYFWDMDNTVMNNDCDVSWKQFLIQKRIAPENCQDKIDYFYEQYLQGKLQIDKFMEFQLAEFAKKTPDEMAALANEHYELFAKSAIYSEARKIIQEQLTSGAYVCLITATNSVIATPVAKALGIKHLIGAELEIEKGYYTGKLSAIYPCGENKIQYIQEICQKNNKTLKDVVYYGDSDNDIPILEVVGTPIAVCPAPHLREKAKMKHWKILDFKL